MLSMNMVVLVPPKAPRAIETLIQDPQNTISNVISYRGDPDLDIEI